MINIMSVLSLVFTVVRVLVALVGTTFLSYFSGSGPQPELHYGTDLLTVVIPGVITYVWAVCSGYRTWKWPRSSRPPWLTSNTISCRTQPRNRESDHFGGEYPAIRGRHVRCGRWADGAVSGRGAGGWRGGLAGNGRGLTACFMTMVDLRLLTAGSRMSTVS
jgi:hypothetical protein